MNTSKPKRFYTTGDVARYCEVDVNTVKRWIRGGSLEAFSTPSGHYRIARDRFIAFVKAQGFTYDPVYFGDGRQPTDILIVANDLEQLDLFTYLIDRVYKDIRIETASNDFDGYQKIHHNQPRIVILDLNISDISGLEFLRVVRSKNEFRDLKILVIYDHLTDETRAELKHLKVNGIIAKPLNEKVLKEQCNALLMGVNAS